MEEFNFPEEHVGPDEPGAPGHIRHCCDYMRKGDSGWLEFHYNFFVYEWRVFGPAFSGRTYSDTIHRIALFLPYERQRQDDCRDVVLWLQRRFRDIETFERDGAEKGYIRRWQLRPPRAV